MFIVQGPRPTFPAYGNTPQQQQEEPKKPALIATTGSSSKIIHPPEDISLEEIRADMAQYRGPVQQQVIVNVIQGKLSLLVSDLL